MSEVWDEALAEYEAAQAALQAKADEVGATFAKTVAGPKADSSSAIARIEAEYVAKVREAKGELAATTRRVHAQLTDFRLTRDALVRAEKRKLEGLLAPAKKARKDALSHLRATKDEAWERYHKLRWPV